MQKASDRQILDRARDAMGSGAWREAYDLFSAADAEQELDAETLPMLADAAYMTGHPEVSVDVWERIHAAAGRGDDPMGAAGAAVRVCFLLLEAGLTTQTRGWVRRAERLLDGQLETPIHGALAVAQTYRLLWSGEVDAALGWARRAIEVGNRFSDPATIAFGRVGEARALILQGHVEEGLLLLDEAAVAAVASGEGRPPGGPDRRHRWGWGDRREQKHGQRRGNRNEGVRLQDGEPEGITEPVEVAAVSWR